MSVQKTTIFVHRQLSPTIVEFSASLSSNWLSGGSRHVVINENAVDMAEDGEQTRGSSGGLAAHDHGEMQPLLGDIPSAFRAPASRGFSWMRDYAPQVLRGGTFSNCMLWLLLARWYGLYVVAFAGVFSYGLLWHSTIAIALGFAGLAIVAVTVSRTVYQESVTVIRQIGIQIRVRRVNGTEQAQFIDKDKLDAVFIHEYIQGSSVNTALAFVLRGESRLRLVFQHCYPGFAALRSVYQACLVDCKQ